MSPPAYVHASAVVVGEAGVLIRGASGAGKSTLAATLIRDAHLAGRFARLIGDDRIGLVAAGGRLVARAHPALHGQIERAGLGIIADCTISASVVRLVVDLTDAPIERLPATRHVTLLGVEVPGLLLAPRSNLTSNLVLACLASARQHQHGAAPI